MIGRTISHYKILEKLGEGGMGVVYKAEDTKLGRTVALKFLPPELTKNPEARERFVHEAKAASSLDHPGICTIYEIDETAEGQMFLSMACYDGETLRERIDRGPLRLNEAVEIARRVAEGLAKAHSQAIVHRDIKPGNIFLTNDGQVKIVDFGLAKLAGQIRLTTTGTTVGTVAYMSPEQARGEEADERSDIWSLGVVFYEMVAGRLPFRGEHEAAVLYSILNVSPEPLTGVRTDVPMDLEGAVLRCMAKDRGERYQTAGDLAAKLRHINRTMEEPATGTRRAMAPRRAHRRGWVAGLIAAAVLAAWLVPRYMTPTKDRDATDARKMLVVLPFENLGSPNDEYFADGITEEITSRLALLHGLGVISRTSAFHYKGTTKTIREIGEELGVGYVLEGTVRWERRADGSSHVRVTPQLIRVSDDTHVWADHYDQELQEIFVVQSGIAERVASELNVTLVEPERLAIESRPTENLEAYQAYLRALSYWNRPGFDMQSFQIAAQMFERAIELDPEFVLAYTELVSVYGMLYLGAGRREEHRVEAQEALDRVMALEPDLPQVRLAKGYFHYACFNDYDLALEEFRASERGLPNDPQVHQAFAYIYRRQGRFEDAILRFERALELDPRDAHVHWQIGGTLLALRRFEEADRHVARAIALSPDIPEFYRAGAFNLVWWRGAVQEARSFYERAPGCDGPEGLEVMVYLDLAGQNYEDALGRLAVVSVDAVAAELTQAELHVYQAHCHRHLDQPDQAEASLQRALLILERLRGESPRDEETRALLGQVYAMLGRKEEALREAKMAVDLTSGDRMTGPGYEEDLAVTHAWAGEEEKAISQLENLSKASYFYPITLWRLRLEPAWDPLRDSPRFQRLLKEYAEPES